MPVVVADRRKNIEVQHGFRSRWFRVVHDVGGYTYDVPGTRGDDLVADMEESSSTDDIGDLLKRVAVGVHFHPRLQPVHDHEYLVARKTATRDALSHEFFRKVVPIVFLEPALLVLLAHVCTILSARRCVFEGKDSGRIFV